MITLHPGMFPPDPREEPRRQAELDVLRAAEEWREARGPALVGIRGRGGL